VGERTALYEELVHHLPFSVSAVAIGLTVAGIICFLTPVERAIGPDAEDATGAGVVEQLGGREDSGASDRAGHDHEASEGGGHGGLVNPFQGLFHLFHPVHMLFSAAATTAMFWRYERRVLKAVLIGLAGAVGVCGLSDIVMPHVSLMLLGKFVAWHICLVENPQMVLTFAVVGVGVGLAASAGVQHSTFFSHSLHVFSSTMASIFYLVGPFGGIAWIDSVGIVFLFVIVAVAVPCCLSDIVFPLFLAGGAHERYRGEHCGGGCEGH
jgi:hypothetical protein